MKLQICNDLTKDQVSEIKEFDDEDILAYLLDPYTFKFATINDNTKILAIGLTRVINEFKMAIRPELSNFQRAKITKLLMNEAIKQRDCNEIFIQITKDKGYFGQLLKKHYNFNSVDYSLKMEL